MNTLQREALFLKLLGEPKELEQISALSEMVTKSIDEIEPLIDRFITRAEVFAFAEAAKHYPVFEQINDAENRLVCSCGGAKAEPPMLYSAVWYKHILSLINDREKVRRSELRHPPVAINCRCDGDQVSALIGPDLMQGVAGFGENLPEALRDLATELEREVGQLPLHEWIQVREQQQPMGDDEMSEKLVTLAECPPGLFLFDGALGFKSEYGNEEVFCADSGECFWGGTDTKEKRAALLVRPIEGEDLLAAQPHTSTETPEPTVEQGQQEWLEQNGIVEPSPPAALQKGEPLEAWWLKWHGKRITKEAWDELLRAIPVDGAEFNVHNVAELLDQLRQAHIMVDDQRKVIEGLRAQKGERMPEGRTLTSISGKKIVLVGKMPNGNWFGYVPDCSLATGWTESGREYSQRSDYDFNPKDAAARQPDAAPQEKPEPDSADWWREVAQQLGFKLSKLRLTLRLLPSDVRGVLIQVYGEKADCSRDKELAEALTLAARNRMKIDERTALSTPASEKEGGKSIDQILTPNGAFTERVRDVVLAPSFCGKAGHFKFQQNGSSCLRCQAEAREYLRGMREMAEKATKHRIKWVGLGSYNWKCEGCDWVGDDFEAHISSLIEAEAKPGASS